MASVHGNNNSNSNFYKRKSSKSVRNLDSGSQKNPQEPVSSILLARQEDNRPVIARDKAMESVNVLLQQQVTINLSSKSKHEKLNLKKKLQAELDLVRNLVKKIEEKDTKPKKKRAYVPNLSISVVENNKSQPNSDVVEKEKRTPKANKFYRNSEFILAKDKFPPSESHKKTKPHGKKESGSGHIVSNFSNKTLKNCSTLLERLMKHKHGWVFNTPVDPVSLGLRDYLEIIKHPMDLGTVKSRLDTNWYKNPKEFADDVRITFNNAMTYNPEGQDVHVMAELLLKIFEEKWVGIESEYMQELGMNAKSQEVSLPTPTPRKGGASSVQRISKNESFRKGKGPGRTPASKKPKARDPNKRDMTYEEKQVLSSNLQNMPSDKLDDVVKIIKKRNSSLCQNDEEIEIDIDSVDTETLWELDRFVTNFNKMLSKNKRKAEPADQAELEAAGSEDRTHVHEKIVAPVVEEEHNEAKSDENNVSSASPAQGAQQLANANRSISASSSSAGGSGSSSDSESGSSSGDGSDAGHSPKEQV